MPKWRAVVFTGMIFIGSVVAGQLFTLLMLNLFDVWWIGFIAILVSGLFGYIGGTIGYSFYRGVTWRK